MGKKILLFISLIVATFLIMKSSSIAQTPSVTPTPTPDKSQELQDLEKKINELESKVSELQGTTKTLSSQISVMNNQIKLTELRIEATKREILEIEADIDTTNKKISGLERSLSEATKILIKRIVATYQAGSAPSFQVLVSSSDVNNFFKRVSYLRIAQVHDKQLIYETQQAKLDYSNQKEIFEDEKEKILVLKEQLDGYNTQLDQEKKSKQSLLDLTMNDEKKYQDMLAKARAEYLAIQGIVAGKGSESEVGDVGEGARIASIISGQSTCSTGTHLHFEVVNGGHQNPANYLSNVDIFWDDTPFSFTGNWRWPINGKPRITQGYGMTDYARTGAYGGGPHTGLDVVSGDLSVLSVKEGKLFRGSISCRGGQLRYVKVQHKEGGETYYLHVNYVF